MSGTGIRSELTRKAVHIGMGGFALALRWLSPWQAALIAVIALGFNLFVLHRLTGKALLRAGERARGFSAGIALYPAAVLGLILVFHSRLELAAAAWGLLAFGDGMATVAGVLLGGPRLPWNRAKTWSGLAAFVLYGTAAATFLIRWTQQAVVDGALAANTAVEPAVGASYMATTVADAAVPEWLFLLLGCLAATLAAAFVESLDSGVDDNLLVPLVGGGLLYLGTWVQPSLLVDAASTLGRQALIGLVVNAALGSAAYAARSVSLSGALSGALLGTLLLTFGGWQGFAMLLLFFVLGTASTKLGYADKARRGIAQERGGRRGAGNAFANVSVGLLCAFLAVATSHPAAFTVAMVAAFATATCDTVSSEIGQAYGRRHHLVTTFRRVPAGTDGAVSVEGTLAGLLGAAALAGAAWALGLIEATGALIVTVAGFSGATFESYVGAAFHGVRNIDNELVNFGNTAVGALIAGLLFSIA